MEPGSTQTRIIVEAVKATVSTLESNVKEIRDYRYTDLWRHLAAFGAGVVLVMTALVTAYFKLDDKISGLSTSNTRIETKLDDLIARIPPVPTAPPRRN
jgi:hypothetical protein